MYLTKPLKFLSALSATLLVSLSAGCGSVQEPAKLTTLAKPAKEIPYHETFNDTYSCGDFEVALSAEVSGTVTTFFDQEGNPVRMHARERFFGTNTNLTTGYTVTDGPDSYQFFIDLVDETTAVVGLYFMVRDADGKKVAIDVGKITFSPDGVTISGPHDIYENGICPYLDH
jgi:hypothetical protein